MNRFHLIQKTVFLLSSHCYLIAGDMNNINYNRLTEALHYKNKFLLPNYIENPSDPGLGLYWWLLGLQVPEKCGKKPKLMNIHTGSEVMTLYSYSHKGLF